jgi:putative transposase
VLGIWVQSSEGAKFWLGVLAELANRGMADALIVCCDGLTGLPEAIEATWPKAVVQTCTVHRIRASAAVRPRYGPQGRRRSAEDDLHRPTATAAAAEPDAFDGSTWGKKYPATVRVWPGAWERFIRSWSSRRRCAGSSIPPTASSRCTTSCARSSRTAATSPTTTPWSSCCGWRFGDIEDRRAQERAKEAGLPKGQSRKAPPKLVEGAQVQHWNQALGALTMAFPGRLEQAL